jgi:hypothetical protein
MRPVTRLGQAIAEGDGITILAAVADAEAAGAAERQGADGLAVEGAAAGVRAASQLPLLHLGRVADADAAQADAVVVAPHGGAWNEADARGLELVVRVRHTEDLERALEELDPEILLFSADPNSEEHPLDVLLALLHDVPAGKLAIAELRDASTEDVAELERAGVDAVLVRAQDVAALVPVDPPDV